MGAYVKGEPVLITANGTKDYLVIKCWNSDMSERWVFRKTIDTSGCQGSHMSPIVDINNDGVDGLFWGERCIELDKGKQLVLGVKIGKKKRSAEGEHRVNVVENTFHAFSGEKIELGFSVYTTIPVDLNGDGIHELVKGYFEGDATILDNSGKVIGNIGGASAIASKFTGDQGEQILSYSEDGIIKIWVDRSARDNEFAKERYSNPFYKVNQKQTGNGYNLFNLGGI